MPRAQANGIEIEYETFGDQTNPPMLLIMGLGVQMLGWDERVLQHAGGPRLLRDPLRQPRRGPLHAHGWPGPEPARADGAATSRARATRSTTWPTTRPACWTSSASRPRTWGSVDGRDDRADARGQAPRPRAVAGVDHVDDRQQRGRSAQAGGPRRTDHADARRPRRLHRRRREGVQA